MKVKILLLASILLTSSFGVANAQSDSQAINVVEEPVRTVEKIKTENIALLEKAGGLSHEDAIASVENDEQMNSLARWAQTEIPGFAGFYVDHNPYRATIRVAGKFDESAIIAELQSYGVKVPVSVLPAKRSLLDVQKLTKGESFGYNPRTGKVKINANKKSSFNARGFDDSEIENSPVIVPLTAGGWPDQSGATGCTMGFALYNGSGQRFINTAGHCFNGSPVYPGGSPTLGLAQNELWSGGSDTQSHLDPVGGIRTGLLAVPNVVMTGPPVVPAIGTTVCSYGKTTFTNTGRTSTCAPVTSYYNLSAQGASDFYVEANLQAATGDSGGPVWQALTTGNRPVGNVSAGVNPVGLSYVALAKNQVFNGTFFQEGLSQANPNAAGTYHAITPVRAYDTRTASDPVAARTWLSREITYFPVASNGVLLKSVYPDTRSVLVTLTVINPNSSGNVKAWSSPDLPSATSVVNFTPGRNTANTFPVRLDLNNIGGFKLKANNPALLTDFTIDIIGYFSDYSMSQPINDGSVFFRSTNTNNRIYDSRVSGVPIPSNGILTAYVPGVPATAKFAAVNITATAGTTDGYLTAFAAGAAVPPTSNLNFLAGQDVGRFAVVPIGVGGSISVKNGSPGTTHVVIDMLGYLASPIASTVGKRFITSEGERVYDSRTSSAFGPNETRTITPNWGNIPFGAPRSSAMKLADSVLVNITTTGASINTWASVYPTDIVWPGTSTTNAEVGVDQSNFAWVPLDANGNFNIRTGNGYKHVIVDVVGYTSN